MAELLGALKELKDHELIQAAVLVIAFLVWLGAYMRGRIARDAREAQQRRDPYGTGTEAFFGGPVTEALNAIRDVGGAIERNTRELEEMRTDATRHSNENNARLDDLIRSLREQRAIDDRPRPRPPRG